MMLKTLVAIPERCTGCHRCEMWCSMVHTGEINITRSRIHVLRREPSIDSPLICLQCGICLTSCPLDLIKRSKKTGAVKIQSNKCVLCGRCILACPYGMISVDPFQMHAVKCDLCGGDPECVKHCGEEAIVFSNADEVAQSRRESTAKLQRREGHRYPLNREKLG
jgi:anaerobic carbon-monoxide dehydrogenase iron sulfur subunit